MGWEVNATPRPLYARERPGTHCIGGWVVPRAGLKGCEKSRPPPGFDPRTVQPVASSYTDWAIPAPTNRHCHGIYTHHVDLVVQEELDTAWAEDVSCRLREEVQNFRSSDSLKRKRRTRTECRFNVWGQTWCKILRYWANWRQQATYWAQHNRVNYLRYWVGPNWLEHTIPQYGSVDRSTLSSTSLRRPERS